MKMCNHRWCGIGMAILGGGVLLFAVARQRWKACMQQAELHGFESALTRDPAPDDED